MKKLDETASGGATSAGSIASVPGAGLNYSLLSRVPKPEFKGYTVYEQPKKKGNKRSK